MKVADSSVSGTPLGPFSVSYSAQLPELFQALKCSLAVTTYQAGKVVLLSPVGENKFSILPRSFSKPMGMALEGNRMALATTSEVITFVNTPELASFYPNKPGKYDHFFVPRATYYTGQVDLHDLHFGKDALWAVNTSFSCICRIDASFSFIPEWKPSFISDLQSEDRCHLNGMVMKNGVPAYVTALGATNTRQGWRNNIVSGGVLLDVVSNETIAGGLAMPHSPKMHEGFLYMLLSASGELVRINPATGTKEVLRKFDRFVRGLSIYKDHAFIGTSKLRKNSSTFAHLPFAENAQQAGVIVVHLPTLAIVGEFVFQTSVDEIYEVMVLPDCTQPNILNTLDQIHQRSLTIPGATFWASVPETEKSLSSK